MISRVADHCFWLGRYLERVESTSRVLFVTRNVALDSELTPLQCWQPVVIVAGESERFGGRFGLDASGDGERVERYMTWDEENPCSIFRSVAAARENARSIREVVSFETWEALNELYLWMNGTARAEYQAERYGFYRRLRQGMQLCVGLVSSTMLHDTPWEFIRLGILLEGIGQTARILDVHHHAVVSMEAHRVIQTALWLALLRACSGFEPFMKRYQGRVSREGVAEFLVVEPHFPRSIQHCVRHACECLSAIRPPEDKELPGRRALERLGALDAWLGERARQSLAPELLHGLLTHVVNETAAVCESISEDLLGNAPSSPTVSQNQ